MIFNFISIYVYYILVQSLCLLMQIDISILAYAQPVFPVLPPLVLVLVFWVHGNIFSPLLPIPCIPFVLAFYILQADEVQRVFKVHELLYFTCFVPSLRDKRSLFVHGV